MIYPTDLSGLSREQLIRMVETLQAQQKYGLVWNEDRAQEHFDVKVQSSYPILERVADREVMTHSHSPMNLLIEGDNYYVLTVLQYTHREKVDVIYIDPPYNTGNKDFRYNDNYIDREDSYRHSKWLSFMYKRLMLARAVLKPSGVIFISIDDNEAAQLKLLCDRVFGEQNFVENFSWVRTRNASNLSKTTRKVVEHILCYQKSHTAKEFRGELVDGSETQPLLNSANRVGELSFPPGTIQTSLPDGIVSPGVYDKVELLNEIEITGGVIITPARLKGRFKWVQTKLDEEIARGTEFIIKTIQFSIRFRRVIADNYKPPKNLIDSTCGVGTNEDGRAELNSILGENTFSYPKPVSLIKYLLSFFKEKDLLILDFFAGSGTSGQAVLQLNQEDGGTRQFILVTNNENNICEEITYPRLANVIRGYKDAADNMVEGLSGNLIYLRTAFIAKNDNLDQMKLHMAERCAELLCIQEGVFQPVKLTAAYQIFKYQDKVLGIYHDMLDDDWEAFKQDIQGIPGRRIVYHLALGSEAPPSMEGLDNFEVRPVPQKILEIYQEVSKQ